MSKFQYCSDLHLEFPSNVAYIKRNPIKTEAEILLLAGDIVPFAEMHKFNWFFEDLSKRFEQVFWIPGNHEYYFSDIAKRSGSFKEKILENVYLLNNKTILIDNTRLIFSTLWTQLSELNKFRISQLLSDFLVIRKGDVPILPDDYNAHFQTNLEFIKNALGSKQANEKVLVVTHHVPTFQHYPVKYRGDILNEAFAIELSDLILDYAPDYWIYGHHHNNTPPFNIGKTRLLTNQLAYVNAGEGDGYANPALI